MTFSFQFTYQKLNTKFSTTNTFFFLAPFFRALEVLDSLEGISINVLSETGVGKTVNGLKRNEARFITK